MEGVQIEVHWNQATDGGSLQGGGAAKDPKDLDKKQGDGTTTAQEFNDAIALGVSAAQMARAVGHNVASLAPDARAKLKAQLEEYEEENNGNIL